MNKNLIAITKVILVIILAYLSFKIAYPIANSLVHIKNGPGFLILFLFLGPVWGIVFISIVVAITFSGWNLLSYFFDRILTKEKNNDSPQQVKKLQKKPFYTYIINTIVGTLITVILVVFLFVSYLGYLGSQPKVHRDKHSWSSKMKFTGTGVSVNASKLSYKQLITTNFYK